MFALIINIEKLNYKLFNYLTVFINYTTPYHTLLTNISQIKPIILASCRHLVYIHRVS